MSGNPSLKGANRKQAWERGLHTGIPGLGTGRTLLPSWSPTAPSAAGTQRREGFWVSLSGHSLVLLFFLALSSSCIAKLPKTAHSTLLSQAEEDWSSPFLWKRTWMGLGFVWRVFLVFFPPSTFFSKTVFPVGWVFLFLWTVHRIFLSCFAGAIVSCKKFGGNSSFGDSFLSASALQCGIPSTCCCSGSWHQPGWRTDLM